MSLAMSPLLHPHLAGSLAITFILKVAVRLVGHHSDRADVQPEELSVSPSLQVRNTHCMRESAGGAGMTNCGPYIGTTA